MDTIDIYKVFEFDPAGSADVGGDRVFLLRARNAKLAKV